MCVVVDVLLALAIVLIVLWILGLPGVAIFTIGAFIHILIVVAVIFLILWIFTRFCYGGGYGRKEVVVV